MRFHRTPSVLALLAALALPAHADGFRVQKNAVVDEECGSCHMVYPPQLLGAASWRALMNGLPQHFGSDASLDEKRRIAIADFLVKNSSRRDTRDPGGKPLLRYTESAHFKKEHGEVSPAIWQRASIKSAANCSACHTGAATGDYDEDSIRIPK